MTNYEKRILLGEITGVHGLRGEVLVRSFTSEPDAITSYGTLTDAEGNAPLALTVLRTTPKGALVARVAGVRDRDAAEALKGRKLYVARAALPAPAAEDDFYHADLVGLEAFDTDGRRIGEVVAVQNYGAGDLVELRLAGRKTTVLVPFTRAAVPRVDIGAGTMTLVLPVDAVEDAEDRAAREAAQRERSDDGGPD